MRLVFHSIAIAVVGLSFLSGIGVSGQEQKPAASIPETIPLLSGSNLTLPHTKESFSNLSLMESDLHPEPPVQGGTDETSEYVRELLQMKWRWGDPIDLWVIRPRGVKNPPVVLYLYSYPSETDRFKDDRYCRRVVSGGAAAVGFVSALTGHRYANRPMKEWFISELPESLAKTVHDVQMILNYLETRGDLDMSRVGIYGQGSGGAIAILAAAADPRIKALDLHNPWGDWPDWLAKSRQIPEAERANFLEPHFLKRLEPLEPMRYLPELKSRP